MRRLTFAFLVVIYLVFTHIKGDIKSTYFENENRTRAISDLLKKLVNNSNINVTNATKGDDIDIKIDMLNNEERGKLCLKNITECMENDEEYELTTDRLSSFLFSSMPPFDLSKVHGVGRECQRQSKKYVEDLQKFKLWALRMYDSAAKLPSGILNGNVNQFGDFDMCLAANLESPSISGKYCLASMEVQAPHSIYLAGLHRLVQSHFHFRSKLKDPGHRVPRFSSINWALCVPSSCTGKDVELGLQKTIKEIIKGTEIEVRYEVDEAMCQTVQNDMPLSTYIGTSMFVLFLLWELFATIYDYWSVAEKSKWIMAFSLRKNFNSLLQIKKTSGDIEAVHGIRCINALLLLLAHKSMAVFFQPYVNRTECVEYLSRPFSVIARAASLYTDPFIMLSGTLTAYSIFGKLNRSQKINVLQEYTSRLFRVVPALAALIAFCTFVLPWLNSGPLWNLVVTHHSNICKQYWWRNLLFIHNYFGFKDMCLTHTHHIGIDTQLFFLSPFLIYILWKWPKKGGAALIAIATISTIMRYYVTFTMGLSNYVHFGTSIQQLFETADNMYILPAHRITVYIVGIFLGYILRNYKNIQLQKAQLRIGNTIALSCFLISFLGPSYMSKIDYEYDPTDAAWYAAISPILWCFSFAWVIFTNQLGYKDYVGRFFSIPAFKLWTKISYTVYLTQFPVYFYNVGVTRTSTSYGFFSMSLSLKEYIWVIALSVVLTITFEYPFQNIRNILFDKKEVGKSDPEREKKVS